MSEPWVAPVISEDDYQLPVRPMCSEKVTVTHWRAVNADGGCAFSRSTATSLPGLWPEDLKDAVVAWCERYPQYHLEEWEQTYWVSETIWKRIPEVTT
jgi:hypothetical protein